VGEGALGGMFWGMLFGLLFFIPLLGAAIGAGMGALAGSLGDVGIDDDFIKSVRDEVEPGTSALFLMTSDAVVDRVKEQLAGTHAQLIHTNLSNEQEAALRQVFSEEAATGVLRGVGIGGAAATARGANGRGGSPPAVRGPRRRRSGASSSVVATSMSTRVGECWGKLPVCSPVSAIYSEYRPTWSA
jgi:hypothetical protein